MTATYYMVHTRPPWMAVDSAFPVNILVKLSSYRASPFHATRHFVVRPVRSYRINSPRRLMGDGGVWIGHLTN